MAGAFALAALLASGFRPTSSSAATPGRAGTLVVADDDHEPLTLDPFLEFSEKNHTILQQMLEGLVRLGPQGDIEPALAVSWEQLSPLRLRFHLRHGVKFHDGEPLDSAAVRFSLERYLDPRGGYPGRSFFPESLSVVTPADDTVDLVTSHPDASLLRRLAGLILVAPPRYYARVGSVGFSRHPIGTGPFLFDHWTPSEEIVLNANRAYWSPGRPRLERLVFRFLPFAKQVPELLAGHVDLVTEMPGTNTLLVARNKTTAVLKYTTWYTVGATFNSSQALFSDLRFRQALNYAIDRAELIRYDLLGNGHPAATLSLPHQFGHNPDLSPYPYDIIRARNLIARTGSHLPIHLKVLVRVQGNRAAKILAAQLRRIGVVLELTPVDEPDILRMLSTRRWDMAIAGMSDPTGDAGFIQTILLSSHSPYSLFKSDEVDRRLKEISQTTDSRERERRARTLDRYIYDQALSLFTYQRIKTCGMRKGLVFRASMSGMPYFDSTYWE